MAETSLRRGLQLSRGDWTGFVTNPSSGTFLALAVVSSAWQMLGEYRASRGPVAANPLKLGGEE